MGIKHLSSQYQSADFSIRHSSSPCLDHDTSLLLFCLCSHITGCADVLCFWLWKTKKQRVLVVLGSFSEEASLESLSCDIQKGSYFILDAKDTWKTPAQVGIADCV